MSSEYLLIQIQIEGLISLPETELVTIKPGGDFSQTVKGNRQSEVQFLNFFSVLGLIQFVNFLSAYGHIFKAPSTQSHQVFICLV